MDIRIEEKKITIAHRLLHSRLRRSMCGYNDGGFHNLRAYLINRVERESNYELIVELDGADPQSVAKIINRKEWLREKYGDYKA